MSLAQLAQDIHREFKAKPESQFIATAFALKELANLIAEKKPRRILEIGAGIGTITKLLLTHPDRPDHLTVTEANSVCLAELSKNLAGLPLQGYHLVNSAAELDLATPFDLVIFDGTLDHEKQYQVFQPGTWCFVEGSRSATIATLKQKLGQRGLALTIETRRPGGYKVKYMSARRIFGFRHPTVRFKPLKGCSIGQVSRLQ